MSGSIHPQHRSEVTRLREQIEHEHEAACWAREGLAIGTAQHWFIARRMERIGAHQERLSELIGQEETALLLIQVFKSSPPQRPPGGLPDA